jgi:CO/xanthine dehydrogenase Mo-binding subunit
LAKERKLVGSAEIRVDAWEKITGRTRYIDDAVPPGAWVGGCVRSQVARGRIENISRDPKFDWSQVVVITAADLPGPNATVMILDDHPIIAGHQVNHLYEPIVLVAAPTSALLKVALAAIEVTITPLPAVFTMEDSLAGEQVIWGEDNILSEYTIRRGDPGAGFAAADRIIEGIYHTGHQEHFYLEPNGIIAAPLAGGGIEVIGSLQCPYYVQAALTQALNLPESQVVIRQAPTGGAFGGKEDFPSVLAMHAALLALKSGQPVKIIYDRAEDIRSTTKRHPSRVYHRTGVKLDGTLTATEIDVVFDGGAYTTLSPVVLSRGILHAAGVYKVPNVAIRGRAVATNTATNGAFRGFGAPQTIFAIERHMDLIARELSIDPLRLRRHNLLREGDTLPYGQVLKSDGAGGELVLNRILAISDYEKRKAEIETENSKLSSTGDISTLRRGIGLSIFHHGGGFTGSGEEKISGKVKVRYQNDAVGGGERVEILISNVEMGQGLSTVMAMMAAEALDLPIEKVIHHTPDTAVVPDSGPTVASRSTMIVGRIVVTACEDLVSQMKAAVAQRHDCDGEALEYHDGWFSLNGKNVERFFSAADAILADRHELIGFGEYQPVPGLKWDEENYVGDAYKSYSWGANVVEVTVDPATYEINLIDAKVVVEIGKAINPVLVAGQVEGGTLQALGYAGLEEMKLSEGRYLNDRAATYTIATSLDAPDLTVDIVEIPYDRGPYGAKGVGELPMNGSAPATLAAIEQATNLFPAEIPMTPEKLYALSSDKFAAEVSDYEN